MVGILGEYGVVVVCEDCLGVMGWSVVEDRE